MGKEEAELEATAGVLRALDAVGRQQLRRQHRLAAVVAEDEDRLRSLDDQAGRPVTHLPLDRAHHRPAGFGPGMDHFHGKIPARHPETSRIPAASTFCPLFIFMIFFLLLPPPPPLLPPPPPF